MTERIAYRPLAEADLPLMADWLNRPHLRAFYQREPILLAGVAAKYGPRIRHEVPTQSWLAVLGGKPFGYLQCYRVADWADCQATFGVDHGVSIDLFIGEPDLIGQGVGRRMLSGYVEHVAFPQHPKERLCWIGHELENVAARRCSAAAGFVPVREYVEDGNRCILMVRQTPAQTDVS
jgi:aminoglycoside 6'-N-acetyltransferase